MKKGQPLGLDELMIVNPSSQDAGMVFLGDDGTLYQVQKLSEGELQGLGHFFLGEDGTLYKAEGGAQKPTNGRAKSSAENPAEAEERELGRFFLGDDGTLYEVVK
jgi:hypothetical protein